MSPKLFVEEISLIMNSKQNFLINENIRKFGIQEVERPDSGSLIRELKGLLLKNEKFLLSSSVAKINLFH